MRIPLLLDLQTLRGADAVRSGADSALLDRRLENRGPLINRLLARRLRSTLCTDDGRLPSALPRDDPGRLAAQQALSERLDALPRICDDETLDSLAAAVRGDPHARAIGALAQQAVGRLFARGYIGDADSWQAALDFDAGVRGGIFKLLWLRISGRLRRARRLLAERVGGDRSGVHGTGIAVHTLAGVLERMAELWRASPAGQRPPVSDAIALCLRPPGRAVRQAVASGSAGASVRAGTIVLFELDKAFEGAGERDLVFLSPFWSRCPADQAVVRLLTETWTRAEAQKPPPPWFPATGDLRISWSRQHVAQRTRLHRIVAAAAAAVQALAAVLLIAAPGWVGLAAATGARMPAIALALCLAIWTALIIPAPSAARRMTVGLLVAQVVVGATLLFAPAPLRWAGLAEIVLAIALGWSWWRMMTAELMTRP